MSALRPALLPDGAGVRAVVLGTSPLRRAFLAPYLDATVSPLKTVLELPFSASLKRLAIALLSAVLTACSGNAVLNSVSSANQETRASNLIYDAASNLRLDVYAPPGMRNAPVVLFFYDGQWKTGSKEEFSFVADALNAKGFVTVIADYRKYPAVRFPSFVEDGAKAVAWTQRNIETYGGSSQRMFVMGHGAGAHIGAMLALRPEFLKTAGVKGSPLRGFIGLAGAYDFMPITDPELRDLFGPSYRFQESQPIRYANAGAPPILLMHGRDDSVISFANSEHMAAAMVKAQANVETVFYPKLSHERIIGALSRPLRSRYDVLDYIDGFVRKWMDDSTTAPSGIETRPIQL